jgi:leucyl/phenylalanyl-tRNA--protein transferase
MTAQAPPVISPELLLRAYAMGIFPMAAARDSAEIHWLDPERRGIISLDGFHVSRSLARHIARADVEVVVNRDFGAVVDACADREETWINPQIRALYTALHQAGFAHSLEVRRDGRLVGGVYGVTLGAAFFGESMFSRERDASKLALAYLVDRLRAGGFTLFDTQYLTPHLASLGGIEIPRARYRQLLEEAVMQEADFLPAGYVPDPHSVRQRKTQTS